MWWKSQSSSSIKSSTSTISSSHVWKNSKLKRWESWKHDENFMITRLFQHRKQNRRWKTQNELRFKLTLISIKRWFTLKSSRKKTKFFKKKQWSASIDYRFFQWIEKFRNWHHQIWARKNYFKFRFEWNRSSSWCNFNENSRKFRSWCNYKKNIWWKKKHEKKRVFDDANEQSTNESICHFRWSNTFCASVFQKTIYDFF